MLIKGNENDEYINDYPVIKEFKYLGIVIDNKLNIYLFILISSSL